MKSFITMTISCALILATPVYATPVYDTQTQLETQHLLNFIKSTQCQYERNGTLHNGVEALQHIEKKYQYYLDDIHSSEDFIKYSATKSQMSGKKYRVHCPGQAIQDSHAWLKAELEKYRASKTN
ncbi:hypothetical protein A9Q73_00005 [Bermanella sp. 47_1433_sub80_T6]|nr:hypothetical protein A9Q73_00005 [Bermanella sp. 47_1433_sub80_T6]